MFFLNRFFWQTSKGDPYEPFSLLEFFCGTPPSCLKVMVGGGLQDFSVSPRSFGFGFENKGLGPGLDN